MVREVIAVLGGTGTIGQHLIPQLCGLLATKETTPDCPHVVRVLTRNVDKAKEQFAHLNLLDPTGPVILQLVQGCVEENNSLEPCKFIC